jgi:hypothetical protein
MDQRKKEMDYTKQGWKLQDQQHEMQIKQFKESQKLQQEQLDKAREYFKISMDLEDQQIKLTRMAWVEQTKLAEQSAGAAAAAAIAQHNYSLAMLGAQTAADLANAAAGNLAAQGLADLITAIGNLVQILGGGKVVPPSSGGTCFIANTSISMADGSSKHIQDVRVGDRVISWSTGSNQPITATVAKVLHHSSKEMDGYIIVNNKFGVTPSHPMYLNGKWTSANYMQVGDKLQDEHGNEVIVKKLERISQKVPTYNFETDHDTHNYFASGVLVHNATAVMKAAGGTLSPGETAIVGDSITGARTGYEETVTALPGGGTRIGNGAGARVSLNSSIVTNKQAAGANITVRPDVKVFIGNEQFRGYIVSTVEKEIRQ